MNNDKKIKVDIYDYPGLVIVKFNGDKKVDNQIIDISHISPGIKAEKENLLRRKNLIFKDGVRRLLTPKELNIFNNIKNIFFKHLEDYQREMVEFLELIGSDVKYHLRW
jgi:hypothetical protein